MPYSIMLDAGHGGRDPGAVYNGRQEKIDTLSLTLAIGQILQERGIDVLYTRTTDIYESPYQKAMEANEAGVDFFISIHRNSFPQDNAVSGVESLVYDKSGIKLEMAENINEQLEGIGFVNLGVKARPGLVVLRRTKMPAVLVEVGFINSDTDNMLFDDNFSDIALAIAEGILDTLGINTPVVPLPDENEASVAPLPDENTYPDDAFPDEDNVPVVPLPPRYTVQTGAFRNPLYAEQLRIIPSHGRRFPHTSRCGRNRTSAAKRRLSNSHRQPINKTKTYPNDPTRFLICVFFY